MKDCIVREGSINHLESVVDIYRMVFGAKTLEEIQGKLRLKTDVHITVAQTKSGKLVGYGIGYRKKGKYYLWSLAVLPEHRRKGIGSDLIEEQISFAREKGYASFLIKTSNRWKEMLVLLIKIGFNIIGFKEGEWGPDPLGSAVWLEKKIL